MKRIVFIISLIISLMLSGTVYAADALYRMLHAEEVKSFQKDQDAMIVGKLIDKQDSTFSVQVLKVISGGIETDYISVSADFKYGWSDRKNLPSVGDFFVMSLKKKGSTYRKAWGIFRADSGEYKTLKLTEENASSSGMKGDLAAIEWYVNSGGTENDFSFNRGSVFVKRPNGEVIQIFPKADNFSTQNIIFNEVTEESSDTVDLSNNWLTNRLSVGIAIIVVLLLVYFLLLKKRNK